MEINYRLFTKEDSEDVMDLWKKINRRLNIYGI